MIQERSCVKPVEIEVNETVCKPGYFKRHGKCYPCRNGCERCKDHTGQCYKCLSGFIRSRINNACFKKCEKGEFYSYANKGCTSCPDDCKRCNKHGKCLECKSATAKIYPAISDKCQEYKKKIDTEEKNVEKKPVKKKEKKVRKSSRKDVTNMISKVDIKDEKEKTRIREEISTAAVEFEDKIEFNVPTYEDMLKINETMSKDEDEENGIVEAPANNQ